MLRLIDKDALIYRISESNGCCRSGECGVDADCVNCWIEYIEDLPTIEVKREEETK